MKRVSMTFECRPVPWSRSVRGDRSRRRLKQDKYIEDLALMLKLAAEGVTFDGPVRAVLWFNYRGEGETHIILEEQPSGRTKRPDLDNLCKMVLEAIQKSGIVKDDAQITSIEAAKYP